MRMGISTAAFYSRSATEDSILTIGKLGAKVCEVFLDTYSEYEPSFGQLCRQRAQEVETQIVSIHAMCVQFEPQLFSLATRQRQDAWALFEKVLAQGMRLGAKRYVMHGPAMLKGALRNSALARIGPIVSDIADLAKDYEMELCWENVSWCLFSRPEFIAELAPFCKSENLFYTLDIKQAARAGCDPFDFVKAMGEKLHHVHLCDYTCAPQGIALSMPGQGQFDFARLARELRAMGYTGDVMLEPYSDLYGDVKEMGQSLAYLRQIME